METSVGEIEVTWGMNRWVAVDSPRGRVQRQVATREELAEVLAEVGMSDEEAARIADASWGKRPPEAGLPAARGNEAIWRATGISRPHAALLLLAIGALFFYLIYRLG